MTKRRWIALGCIAAGFLAVWVFYPPVDSRFVGTWQLGHDALSFHLGRGGLMTTGVMETAAVNGPNGMTFDSWPTKLYGRWQVRGNKLYLGEPDGPTYLSSAIEYALSLIDVNFIAEGCEEFTIVSVSPDEIVLREDGDDEPIRMIRQKDVE